MFWFFLSFAAAKTSEKELAELIRKLGYKAEPVKVEQEKNRHNKFVICINNIVISID